MSEVKSASRKKRSATSLEAGILPLKSDWSGGGDETLMVTEVFEEIENEK